MKVSTRILGLVATAALTIGALGGSISVASANNGHGLGDSTCGAPQRAATATMIDGIPTSARADGEAFDGLPAIGRMSAESFDGVATIVRTNAEAFDGAAVLAGANEVGIAGAAVSLQAQRQQQNDRMRQGMGVPGMTQPGGGGARPGAGAGGAGAPRGGAR